MAYGQVTKIDPIAMQKPGIKEKPKECTEEELIDSGNVFILQFFSNA